MIADAVHGSEDERAGIEGVAQRAGVSFVGFWLNAPPAMLEARVAARSKDASDADLCVLRQQISTISAPRDWTKLDVSGSQAQVLDSVRALLAQKSNSGS